MCFESKKVQGRVSFDEEMRFKEYYQDIFGDDADIIIVNETEDKIFYTVYKYIEQQAFC